MGLIETSWRRLKAALIEPPKLGEDSAAAAAYGRSPYSVRFWDDKFDNPDEIPYVAGTADGPYSFYEKIADRDPVIKHALRERVSAISGLDSRLEAYDETDDADYARQLVVAAVRQIPRFKAALREMLRGGYINGHAEIEIIWTDDFAWTYVDRSGIARRKTGYYAPIRLAPRDPRYFYFRADDSWLLYSPTARISDAKPVPPRKYIVWTWDSRYENPYGSSLLGPLYILHKFMKHDLKYWGIYNEKFAVPTMVAIAFKELGLSTDIMRRVCDAVQVDSKVVLELAGRAPSKDGTGAATTRLIGENGPRVKIDDLIKVVETASNAHANNFERFFAVCKKVVLENIQGSALLTEEGKGGSGSYALGRSQVDAKWLPIINDDIDALEEVITDTLSRWTVEVNLGAVPYYPRYRVRTDQPKDRTEAAKFYQVVATFAGRLRRTDGKPFALSEHQMRVDLELDAPETDDELTISGGGLPGVGGVMMGAIGPGGSSPPAAEDGDPKNALAGKAEPAEPAMARRRGRDRHPVIDTLDADRLAAMAREPVAAAFEDLYRQAVAYAKKKGVVGAYEIEADWSPHNARMEPKLNRIANTLTEAFLGGWLLGTYQLQRQYDGLDRALAAASPATRFDSVLNRLREITAYTDQQYYALEDNIRRHAWYVTTREGEWVADRMKEAVAEAAEKGLTKTAFVDLVSEKLSGEVPFRPAHLETVYRTNMSTVYNGSREFLLREPHMRDAFPLWAYLAIIDDRTSDICYDLREFVAAADDPRWRILYPPNHYACRSGVQPISRYRIEDEHIVPHDVEFREGVSILAEFATTPLAFLGMG